MAIETATYLSDLNISNPPGSDPVGQADDHIRLLKSVLKATFPNITGPVNSTQAQLNYGVVPTGAIIMWSGASTSIPTGWALCNGGTYAKTDGSGNVTVPDLRDKFVVGAGSSYAVGATGGANSHTLGINNASYALTKADLPLYNLTVTDPGHNHSINDPGHNHGYNYAYYIGGGFATGAYGSVDRCSSFGYSWTSTGSSGTGISINTNSTGVSVSSAGSNTPHTHSNTLSYDSGAGASSVTIDVRSPYYALCFIYKL